ncbi:beta-carotene isomerase D27, chloroplastic isoform X2 [Prunus persica]|uniref:beta-carotene isomerase D27, chloroplastic isoform X2 n=1 Tax=Prunus persica TaxID=3760 RepID=UPI0009AB3492|nr:beta-carotene isomerase D27, chloroplastic isoform X2 [Prunus persica]
MKALAVVRPPSISSWPPQSLPKSQYLRSQSFRIKEPQSEIQAKQEKKGGGVMDEVFLNLFRKKMVEEVGWDSRKPGYDGLIEVANRLMLISPTNSHTKEAAVRILRSLFPPMLLQLYKLLIAPIQGGKVAAIMVARVTAITCEWLMGPCTVNSVDLPDGTSWNSGVFVEKCKYLEQSKCVGICLNTCKLPTQAFMKDYMGVPLVMEPNFSDYSCQFKFGVLPPLPEDDATLKEPCLDICPNATRRREFAGNINVQQCPKA